MSLKFPMRGLAWWICLALLGCSAAPVLAQSAPDLFDNANKLYAQGKFAEAAAAYQDLLKSGQASPAVYFNLGNACFKANQLGAAIGWYRRAEELTPRDPDVQANLRFARKQVQAPSVAAAAWELWLGKLSLNEWTLAASAAVWVCLLLLALGQWRPVLKPALKGYLLTGGILAAALCGCLAVNLHLNRTPVAVVTSSQVIVRQAPLAESPEVVTVHDGAELRVLDRKDEWLQVSPGPNRIGWVRRQDILLSPRG